MNFPLETRLCLQEEIEKFGWTVGAHTYGAPFVFDDQHGDLTIGRFCSIAAGTSLILGNHRTDQVSTFPFRTLSQFWPKAASGPDDHEDRGGIHLGSDIWLGAHCTVLSGVTIGSGAVVAANSVVTKSVEPYAIVAGNPARLVRYRCSERQIEDLLAMAWWDWPDEKIGDEIPFLMALSVDDFITRHRGVATSG